MADKTINLKYAKNTLNFFTNLGKINQVIKKFKSSESFAQFTDEHQKEIGRDTSYAVFEELRDDVKQGKKITIDSFRDGLAKRGVSDPDFQNKILCLLLQNKVGVHFPLGNIINTMLLDKGHPFLMRENYEIALEIKSSSEVALVFKGTWEDYNKDPREPGISVLARVSITPNMVALTDLKITQISDSPTAKAAFQFLESNQQNILEKIITYIKHFFGFNSELRLEESSENDVSWSPSAK